jgi:eukaryotic-like serine/threonine-protein kinase
MRAMSTAAEQDREQRLDEIIAAYLREPLQGQTPRRRQLLESNPDLADELASFFADQDRFKHLAAPLREATVNAAPAPLPRRFGNYELLNELARGGMGVVYQARQYLNMENTSSAFRLVAVKFLLGGTHASPEDLRRFRTEAELIAGLEHPHIVPIYEVGLHEGLSFLSMKLIEGGHLGKHRDRYRRDPRSAAQLLVAVAEAIHFAHARGVLHRDLKPSNILLEQREESAEWIPYVGDFGLARRTHSVAARLSDRNSLSLPSGSTTAWNASGPLTHTGEIVGTPSYMAPEQAQGKHGAVTVAADVYGLGTILYDVLTGRPPFQGASPLDTIFQVIHQEPVPPRQLDRTINRDLETICLKCLHKEPERRYGSAREVADDLRRFLRGEPIQARAAGRVERLLHWARREPVVAGLSLALAASLIVGLVLVGWQWYRAETHLALAEKRLQLAEERREKAEHSFGLAHEAVNEFCVNVNDELEAISGLQRMRKRLLASALNYYVEFLKERGRTPELLLEQAEAYVNVGNIHHAVGDLAESRKAFDFALDIFRELHERDPANLQVRRKLVGALNNQGNNQIELESARACFREALDLANRFLEDNFNDPNLLSSRSIALSNLGNWSRSRGRVSDARDYYQQARMIQEKLIKDRPGVDFYKSALAGTLHNLGVLRGQETGGAPDALVFYQQVCDLREKLAKGQPRNFSRQADLASAYQALANTLQDCRRPTEAMETIHKSLEIRAALVKSNPGVNRFRSELASSYNVLGVLQSRAGDRDGALESHKKGRDLLATLTQVDPDPGCRQQLAHAYFNIGANHGANNRRDEERDSFQKSRELLEQLIKEHPDKLDYRCDLGRTLSNLGFNLSVKGHKTEAILVLYEGVEHQRYAFDRAPEIYGYRHVLNALYGNLGEVERALNHPAESVAAILERQKLWPHSGAELFRCSCELQRTAAKMDRKGVELSEKERAEQKGYSELAMDSLRRAVQEGFKDAERLEKERDLEPLRGREDFQKLLAGLKR